MKLISLTLTGNNEALIGDAIQSVVGWVDQCLVIDTGVTDRSLEVARRVAGDKYVERKFPWVRDFSAARNFALDAAHELGADWAINVDTDERIELRGEELRQLCEKAPEGVLMMFDGTHTYAKERVFRLPIRVRYTGPTHEAYEAFKVGAKTLEKARFVELPKTPEEYRRKFERDVDILSEFTGKHPDSARYFYYLGDSLQNLGRQEEAVVAYRRCAALRGWNEESAWACYRCAEALLQLKRPRDAIDECAAGLARHAGIAELAWLAGFAAWQLGDAEQCVFWALMAVPMGQYKGNFKLARRISFRNPAALYEGPYDLLRFALRRLGDAAGADEAERHYQQALAARTGK